jgi:Na+-transporting methylmalonyl-CoA/oxaloacetate decarboxylase beta subunit
MTLTRNSFIVSLAALIVAWLGLTLVWLGVVDEMSPVTLVLVIGGMIGIFLPALRETYRDEMAKFPADIVRKAWYAGVAAGAATIVIFLALRAATAGDPKLHALLSLPVAAIAGVLVLMATEKGVLRISREKNGSQ